MDVLIVASTLLMKILFSLITGEPKIGIQRNPTKTNRYPVYYFFTLANNVLDWANKSLCPWLVGHWFDHM